MTTQRRPGGMGSVTQLASGKWRGTIQIGWTATGGRRTVNMTASTRKDCEKLVRDKLREIAENGPPAQNARITVKTWAGQWLEHQQTTRAPKAYLAYRTDVTRWIIPVLGGTPLSKITPGDVRRATRNVVNAGRSTTTARNVHVTIVKMLRDAVAEGHTVPARVLAVAPPAKAVNDRDEIPLDHVGALLAAAQRDPGGSRWTAAFLQGMRQGEELGLTWECVDIERRTLLISWQLQALPYRVKGDSTSGFRIPDGYEYRQLHGALCLVRPKSRAGWRLVPMAPGLADALEDLPRRHELVWPGYRAGQWLPQTVEHDLAAWWALQDAAQVARVDGVLGRRYYTHEARHTTATILMVLGVDESIRTAILGHSSIATTKAYQHVNLEMARAALKQVDAKMRLALPAADTA